MSGLLVALLCGGHVLLEGVPGIAKTLLVRTLAACARPRHPAGAVHPGPDARRHHRLDGLSTPQAGEFELPRGPGLHQPPARRRDQPDAAQDPVRAARGDGGAARSRSTGSPAPLPGAVPGGRDPEPGRVRGHLPAARGPARPLPAQGRAADPGPHARSSRSSSGTRPASTPATSGRGRDRGRGPGRHRRRPGRASRPSRSRRRSSATSSTSRAPPGSRPPSASASARAARPRCCGPPAPGPG